MLVMLHGRRPDSAIADPFDERQNEFIRIVEQRDDSTPLARLVLALYDASAAMEELDAGSWTRATRSRSRSTRPTACSQPVIYADSYLQL